MGTDSALAVLARRWQICMVGLLVTLVAVVYAVAVMPLTYKASGSVVLIAPPLPAGVANETGNTGAQNPLLGFNDALNVDASILMTVVGSPPEREKLRAEGATVRYSLAGSVDGLTPLVQVTASSRNAAAAERTVSLVLAETTAVLKQRQAAVGAPADTYIRTSPLSPPGAPTQTWKGRIEYLLIACLMGGLVTYLAAFAADQLAASRGSTSRARGGDAVWPEPASSAPVAPLAASASEGNGWWHSGSPSQMTPPNSKP